MSESSKKPPKDSDPSAPKKKDFGATTKQVDKRTKEELKKFAEQLERESNEQRAVPDAANAAAWSSRKPASGTKTFADLARESKKGADKDSPLSTKPVDKATREGLKKVAAQLEKESGEKKAPDFTGTKPVSSTAREEARKLAGQLEKEQSAMPGLTTKPVTPQMKEELRKFASDLEKESSEGRPIPNVATPKPVGRRDDPPSTKPIDRATRDGLKKMADQLERESNERRAIPDGVMTKPVAKSTREELKKFAEELEREERGKKK